MHVKRLKLLFFRIEKVACIQYEKKHFSVESNPGPPVLHKPGTCKKLPAYNMKKALQRGIKPWTSSITHNMFITHFWQVGGPSNIPQTNYYLIPTYVNNELPHAMPSVATCCGTLLSASYVHSLLFHYRFHVRYSHNYVHVMLKGLSNITTQACCLLMWSQKTKQTR